MDFPDDFLKEPRRAFGRASKELGKLFLQYPHHPRRPEFEGKLATLRDLLEKFQFRGCYLETSLFMNSLKPLSSKDENWSDAYYSVAAFQSVLRQFLKGDLIMFYAKKYFEQKYYPHPVQVTFREKSVGVQIGCIALVTLPSEQPMTFYIKTHSLGATVSEARFSTSRVSPVQPEELVAYRLLQKFGLGPECHFFWHDTKDFFVATLDVAHYHPGFCSFSRAAEIPHDTYGSCQSQINQLITADVLSRVCGLTDTVSNSGNFGFSADGTLQIVDFRLHKPIEPASFQGFVVGNSIYHSSALHPFVSFALVKWEIKLRAKAALDFLQQPLVLTALTDSVNEIKSLFSSAPELSSVDLSGLDTYQHSVEGNVKGFVESLKELLGEK